MLKDKILYYVNPFVRLRGIGVDVSDLSIKFVKIATQNHQKIEYYGELPILEGIIEGGEIRREEEFIKILSGWYTKEKKSLKSKFVNIALPEEKSFLRLIQLPRVDEGALKDAVRWEIEANIPLSSDDLVYDFEVPPTKKSTEDHFDVMVSAVPKTIVESYVRVFKAAGLQPLFMELESQAIVRSLKTFLSDKEAKIIVDIGRGRTSFIIFARGTTIYTSTMDFGGKVIEQAIVSALGVSRDKAISIKKELGLDKNKYEGKLFQAMLPSLVTLGDQLKRTMEYYRGHTKHIHDSSEDISEVLLVGGDSALLGLETYLSGVLKIPVRVTYPLSVEINENGFLIPNIPKSKTLAFATAIGLALRNY